jgi:hypothetical protein
LRLSFTTNGFVLAVGDVVAVVEAVAGCEVGEIIFELIGVIKRSLIDRQL